MSNLVPEKRPDRNGKLVTKHVRATPKTSTGKSSVPRPTLSGSVPVKKPKVFKPRARQLEQEYRSIGLWHHLPSEMLVGEGEQEQRRWNHAYTSFEASDVEMYDVMSVTVSTGDTLELMKNGVRTAEEAREYLSSRGLESLIGDRKELMDKALERGIPAEKFISGYSALEGEYPLDSPYLLDGIEFKTGPINYSFNSFLLEQVMNDKVAYDDLKTIGLTRLKPHSRAKSLTDLLTRLHAGEADYTVEDLKAFVIRAAHANTDERTFRYAAQFAFHRGFELLQTDEDFWHVEQQFQHFMSPTSPFRRKHDDEPLSLTYDRIEYGLRLFKKLEPGRMFTEGSTAFFEAGIPYDLAADVVNGGGSLREAQAVHEEGINKSVSGGWL